MASRSIATGAAVAAALALLPSPAAAASSDLVEYTATGCDEVAVLAPTAAFEPDDLLLVLVYACEQATVGDDVIAPFEVSEIAVGRPDSGWRLLRWIGSSRAVARRLQALGFPATSSSSIDLVGPDGDAPGPVAATVGHASGRYALSGHAIPSSTDPKPTDAAGAGYRYDGRRGAVELQYRWDAQEPVPGASTVVIDATADPALASWLGGTVSPAGGVYSRGGWTATAGFAGAAT